METNEEPTIQEQAETPAPSEREIVLEMLRSGRKVKDIVAETGIPQHRVYKVRREEYNEPEGVAPPNVSSPRKGHGKAKPITDETGKQLISGIFVVVAMMDGPEWFLSDLEGKALGSALADSLRVVPNPIADAINTYSAPAIFATTLGAVIQHKLNLRARRGKNPPVHSRPVSPQSNGSNGGSAQGQNPGNPNVVPFTKTAESNAQKASVDDIANAFADARGGLQGEDEEMVNVFQ
jgi:hypothetical protein